MSGGVTRVIVRGIAIAIQWLALTIALGSLVMRSETSFDDVISPHFGAVPMFLGAAIAAFLLGLTIESAKVLAPLVLLMCITAACFIGVLSYAPVVDGILVRTNSLDNWITQRVVLVTIILSMSSIPGAVAGSLVGTLLNRRQEIMPEPDETTTGETSPWWERRAGHGSGTHQSS